MIWGKFRDKEFYIISIQAGFKEPWHYENNNIAILFLTVENMELIMDVTFDGTWTKRGFIDLKKKKKLCRTEW